jgi:phytoene/squalene synthetase
LRSARARYSACASAEATGLTALAQAEYLARALRNYRRDARAGRVPFVVADLLAAGVETRELAAAEPSPALAQYLEHLRTRAAEHFRRSQTELAPALRAPLRHQLVLAALGRTQLARRGASRLASLRDMLDAWNTARRAVR